MQNRTQPTIRSLTLEYSSKVVNKLNLLSHGRTCMIKEETNKVGTLAKRKSKCSFTKRKYTI